MLSATTVKVKFVLQTTELQPPEHKKSHYLSQAVEDENKCAKGIRSKRKPSQWERHQKWFR